MGRVLEKIRELGYLGSKNNFSLYLGYSGNWPYWPNAGKLNVFTWAVKTFS